MKNLRQRWNAVSAKLDAMSLRERVLVFTAVTGLILFLIYTMAVEPLLVRQSALQAQIRQQQNQISGIDAETVGKAQSFVADPDAETRARLEQAQAEINRIGASLLAVQKGLVAPQKIAPLLENMLRGNGKLRLLSLKSLPVTGMNAAAAGATVAPAAPAAAAAAQAAEPANPANPPNPAGAPVAALATVAAPAVPAGGAAAPAVKPRELLYRHGVEIVLEGSYLDMISYMQGLEALPVQLFWGGARLDAEHYPQARLTLTLYTLSLDEKWMKL